MRGPFLLVLMGLSLIGTLESATLSSSVQNSIETRVIVDSWAFNSWKSKVATSTIESKKIEETKTALENYVYSAFNDLNSIFKDLLSSGINFDARIVSIEFITDEGITSENPVGSGQGRSETVLQELKTWLATKGYPRADHTMLLTGLDLTKNGATSNAGKAYVGRMCHLTTSLSVSEASPSTSAILTIAHELGHSMDAAHDGSHCDSGHIMASSHDSSQGSSTNFRFSSCSINYIKNYLQSLQNGDSCLSASNTNIALPSGQPLGERYTPDDICKMVFGSTSYFCRSLYGYDGGRDYDTMCSTIFCKQPDGSCTSARGSDGFVCGQGKKCYLGDCLASNTAPTSVSDSCPQGDAPGSVNDQGQTCSQAVTAFPGNCYSKSFHSDCCSACAAAATTSNAGCEFGDKATWCAGRKYPSDCYNNGDTCCGTCLPLKTSSVAGCEYGDRASWCATLTYLRGCYYGNDASCCASCPSHQTGIAGCEYGDKADWCADFIAQNPDNCRANSATCCKSCSTGAAAPATTKKPAAVVTTQKPAEATTTKSAPAPNPSCKDGSTQCASAIANKPSLCYTSSNEQLCCASCAKVKTGLAGCEYGDKSTQCAAQVPGSPALCYDANNESLCCGSCAKVATNVATCKYGDPLRGCTSAHCRTHGTTSCCGTCNNSNSGR